MKRSARTTKGGFGLLAMLLVLAAALTLPGHAMADTGVRCAPTGIEGVATDRYSYQGGETAFITGSGYAPGCDVLVRITRPDGVVETAPVTTDLSGAFSHQYVLPGPPNLSGEFLLEVVGFGETVLASTEFADALAIETYITPTYVAGSQTLTFRTLVRNTSNDTPIRQINIALPGLPTAYAAKSVANAIFSSGAGTFVMAATPASGFDFTFTATTGNSLALSTGWARFEITATTPALSTGNDAKWKFEACANVGCGGSGSTKAGDDPAVLVNPIPPANRYTADFRTAADVVTAPALTNGVAATLRLRITSAAGNNSSKHITIALPRCFSSPSTVTVTGGSGYDPPAVRDGFIILSGGSVGSVGSFVTVQFTSTPSGCATGAQAFESAVGSNQNNPASGTDQVVARNGNDPVVTFNSPPVANNDAYSVNEDNALTKNAADGVLANDTDADGHTLTAELVTGPANGTLTLNANGSFTYTPNANFFGSDSFTYRATDGFQTSNTATVGITVTAVNDAPSFTKGADVTVAEDSGAYTEAGWATDISAGPANESGQTVTFLVTGNTNAALFSAGPAVSSNGTLTFTTAANAFGTATITLKANDNGGTANGGVAESAAQTFSITVTAVDDAPAAVDDAATVSEDSGANGVDVLANDTDIDGGPKSVASVTQGADGSVAITGGGSGVSYTPNGDYCGPDSFTYTLNGGSTATVTVDVECVNDRPVGVDDAASGTEDTDVIIDPADLLENDTDVDAGDTLSVTAVGSASGGAVELDEGEIVFSPAANLCGEDVASFEYTVSDGELTDTATVTISLTCVNDAPEVTADSASVTVSEGETALNSGTWTDVEDDEVTLTASVGTVTKHEDGTWSWSNATSDGPAESATVTITANDGEDTGSVTFDLTVENVAPSATFNAPESVNEGSAINLSLSDVVDPGSADTHEYRFSCDGGATWTAWGNSTHACETTDDGSVDVRGQVRDDDGAASEVYSDSVTVNNVAPSATFTDNGPVDEGSNISVSLTDVVDPGTADAHEFRFSCDDGTTWTDWDSSATHSCSTNDNGTRNAKGQVRDDDGGTSQEYGRSVTVDNVAPVATITAPETIDEGSNISVSLTDPSDPSSVDTAAGFQFRFSCDGGATWTPWSPDNTHACSTDDNGTENVEGEIRDRDGGTSTYSDSVTVKNVAPTATFNAPTSVNEGSPIAISLTSPSDPSSADTSAGFHYAFDCGDGSGYGAYSSTNTRSCPTSDNGTRTVGGRIKDKDGGVRQYTASVTVSNGPPTLTSLTPSSYLVLKGTAATVTGTYTDPGTSETFTCVVNWDEPTGTPENTAGGANSCSASHTYTVQGTYTISMKVRDDDGGESNTMTVIVTVYDPGAGGFVTGGGWITSPKGSYAGDPEASGRANFGFTSQYKKGASIPTGETEFQLHFATFNFHSEAYEVLVVSGYKAQYRGTGKVNGVTGYRFVLIAYDGQITGGGGTDRFRIKITRIADGVVVYDTKMGVSEDMDLADPLALGGGSIVIHKPK